MQREVSLSRLERFFCHCGGVLVFLMMYTPRANVEVKLPFLAVALVGATAAIVSGRARVTPPLLAWFWLCMVFGVVWSGIGVFNDNPGVGDYFRLHVLWPLLYLPLVLGVYSEQVLALLLRYLLAALIAISLFNIAVFLNAIDWIPSNPLLEFEMGARVGVHEGYAQITSHNIGSLIFLVPLFMTLCLLNDESAGHAITIAFALLLGLIAVVLSGRRALWLLVAIAPVLGFALSVALPAIDARRLRLKVMFILALSAVALIGAALFLAKATDWEPAAFAERLTGVLSDDDGVRADQAKALVRHFVEVPLLGSGFGAGVPEVVRDDERPWIYELYYLLILYNTGILGFAVYAALLLGIASRLWRAAVNGSRKVSVCFAVLVAYIIFLMAAATNPYLGSFDFMFVIFFGLAVANCLGEPSPSRPAMVPARR